MLSNAALAVIFAFVFVGAMLWLIFSFEREDRQTQITQAVAAMDRLAQFWREKLNEEHFASYAKTKLSFIDDDRQFLLSRLERVKAGDKLRVSELVRVENLVSAYRQEDPAHFMLPSSNLEVVN